MRIKVIPKGAREAKGVPGAKVSAVPQTDGKVAQVTAVVSWESAMDSAVVCRVSMSAEEARGLANRLLVAARDAEMLLQNEQTVASRQKAGA